jgi:PAS domain S-box-containing protein
MGRAVKGRRKVPPARMTRAQLLAECRRIRRDANLTLRQREQELEIHKREMEAQADTLVESHQVIDASLKRYAALFEGAPIGYVTHDGHGQVQDINEAGLKLLGRRREEVVGRLLVLFLRPEDRRRFVSHLAQVRRARGEVIGTEVALRNEDRDDVLVQVVSRGQTLVNGEETQYLSAITDLRDRSRIEEALRGSEEQLRERTLQAEQRAVLLRALATELTRAEQKERRRIAAVLHDHLQQLLVSARIKLGIARRQTLDEKTRNSLLETDQLLGDTIKASRSLAISLSPPVLYDAGLVSALEWLARWFMEKHGLKVRLHVDPGVEPLEEGLRVFVFDALRELLLNVVKYAGVTEADLRLQLQEEDRLRAIVEDRGRGFDPAGAWQKSVSDHFGLVSLSERLRLLDSSLEIDSAPGCGARVGFLLPIPQAGALPASSSREMARAEHPQAPGLPEDTDRPIRVLIVDDHAILREGLASVLAEEDDIEIVGQAADGAEAVAMARKHRPDVVVMDVTLPVFTGIEATRVIRSEMPGVHVIGLSMHEEEDMAAAMAEAGASLYLTKGGQANILITSIRAVARTPAPQSPPVC